MMACNHYDLYSNHLGRMCAQHCHCVPLLHGHWYLLKEILMIEGLTQLVLNSTPEFSEKVIQWNLSKMVTVLDSHWSLSKPASLPGHK